MFSPRSLQVLFAVLIGVSLVAGCEQPSTSDVDQTEEGVVRLGSVEAVDSVDRAVALNDRPLVIDGFRGTVMLSGVDQKSAELTFVRRARAKSAEAARGVLEDVTVTESGSQEAYTYELEADGGAYAAVDVSGTVPRNTAVRVKDVDGPITIQGVSGRLTVTHEHGPVTLQDVAAPVKVETKNGDVEVAMRAVPSDARVRVRTRNGDVTLRLPPSASAQISAETSAGVVRTKGLAMADEEFMPRGAGGEYTAQLGAGAASVDLRTENGSILIQAGDTTMTPSSPDALSPPPSDTTVSAPSAPDTTRPMEDTSGASPAPAGDTTD